MHEQYKRILQLPEFAAISEQLSVVLEHSAELALLRLLIRAEYVFRKQDTLHASLYRTFVGQVLMEYYDNDTEKVAQWFEGHPL